MAIISKPVTISKSNSSYKLAATRTLLVNPDPNVFTYAVDEVAGVKNNRIVIEGDVIRPGGDGGIAANGLSTDILIASTADIRAGFGVSANGAGALVSNAGRISASAYAVSMTGEKGRLVNNGTIDGQTAVFVSADDTVITNGAKGRIFGDSNGIEIAPSMFDPAALGTVSIVNRGLIYGGQEAVKGDHADIRLVNKGRIYGDVQFGEGDDTFDTSRGKFFGEVAGGMGDDTYAVASTAIIIHEAMGEGTDTVRSSVDYSLAENVVNVENLVLFGTKAVNGDGNASDNVLTGNAIGNVLIGFEGADRLGGMAGNDALWGGTGADIFAFTAATGRDTIADFEDGVDHIEIAGVKGIAGFADLSNRMKEVNGDVVIKLSKADSITIDNATLAMIGEDDFFWPM